MSPVEPAAKSRTRGVVGFVVLSYAIAWGWAVPLALDGATVRPGEGRPTHLPSLMAPLVASVIVVGLTEGRAGLGDIVRRTVRRRFAPVWWGVVISPAVVAAITVLGAGLAGQELPAWDDFALFGGLPATSVFVTFAAVFVVNGVGEEAGWRGFLQDRLQGRLSPLSATLVVAVVWAVWHAPFFLILSTYSGFEARTLIVFPLGLTAGAVILTWVYNHTGRSILAVALWHTIYNMVVATGGASDLLQGVVTGVVMVGATVLVAFEVSARRHGRPSVLGPPQRGDAR